MNDRFDPDDREEAKEEEYDYFLDPVKDEGGDSNHGYHIIDADPDPPKDSQQRDNDVVDPDEDEDLNLIQDDELREYRYNNMLEDLRESIQEEEDEAE